MTTMTRPDDGLHTSATVGSFLRACRERVQPAELDLPVNGRRRTPGLRREEVAMLASVSVDWYIRLEQDRAGSPSLGVLNAIAAALNMSDPERTHLHLLALNLEPTRPIPDVGPSASLAAVIAGIEWPAYLTNHRLDILAVNPACTAFFGPDFGAGPTANVARMLFEDPNIQQVQLDWARIARETVGNLRATLARYPADEALSDLVRELRARNPRFSDMWADLTVEERSHGTKRMDHPQLGRITVNYDALESHDGSGTRVWVLTPGDDDTREKWSGVTERQAADS